LNINNVNKTLKTDNTGTYTFTYKTTVPGLNNITVSYPGNTRYNPCNTTTTFTVNKRDATLTINTLNSVKYNDKVTVTGKFTDEDGSALINSNVKIKVNNETFTVKTDSNGVYKYTFSARIMGKNNVTVSYPGNTRYNPCTTVTKSFTVNKKDSHLTINSIPQTTKGKTVTITGKFTNADGAALINSNVKLTINNQSFTVKTDATGIYKYTYTTTTKGTNNVTVSYPGNTKYNPCETKTTFKVV
jgi:hypothetical protein